MSALAGLIQGWRARTVHSILDVDWQRRRRELLPSGPCNSLLPAAQEIDGCFKGAHAYLVSPQDLQGLFCQVSFQLVSHQPIQVYRFISSQLQDLAELHIGPFLQPAEANLNDSTTTCYIYHSTQFLHLLQSSFVTGWLLDGSLQLFSGTCCMLEPAVLALLEFPVSSSPA